MKLRAAKLRQIVLAHAKVLKMDPRTFYVPLSGFAEKASEKDIRYLLGQLEISSDRNLDVITWGISSSAWRDGIEQALAHKLIASNHGDIPTEEQLKHLVG